MDWLERLWGKALKSLDLARNFHPEEQPPEKHDLALTEPKTPPKRRPEAAREL
jgi:hypothetical protein